MPTPEEIAAMTPEQLAAQLSQLLADLAQAKSDLVAEQQAHEATKTQAADEIGQLSEKLANATKAAAQGFVTVEHDGKTYKVIGKQFNIKGEIVTVEDLVTNEDAKAYLVKKGSSILVEVE